MAIVVSTNNSTAPKDRLPSTTSLRGLMDGTAPLTLGKGLKAAFIYVDFNSTSYVAKGLTGGLLAALPSWTAILGAVPTVFLDGATPKIAMYDAVSDTITVNVLSSGAEHATSAVAGIAKLLVLGY